MATNDKSDNKTPEKTGTATTAPAAKSSTAIQVKTLQRFDDWSLVMNLADNEMKVVGEKLYGEFEVLPSVFEMPASDWGKATVPADVGKQLGLPADLAKEVNIGVWRRGRVRNDQELSKNVIDGIMGRLRRELEKRITGIQPKPETDE